MPERSADWVKQAKRDLAMAEMAKQKGFHEWSCFISQQSAEKSIKAIYQKLGGVAWGHSVLDLLGGLKDKVDIPAELFDRGRALDKYYIPPRYPNGFERGAPYEYFVEEDSGNATDCARRILQFCESLLAQ